jgi:hypothetical protein
MTVGPGGFSNVTPPPAGGALPVAELPVVDPLGLRNGDELADNGGGLPAPSNATGALAGPLDVAPANCGEDEFRPGICTEGGFGNVWASAEDDSGFWPMYIYVQYPAAASRPMTTRVFIEFMFVLLDELFLIDI